MNRTELGSALRRARHRVQPVDVGLPAGVRRRVPGLRRHEVAVLAGVSVEYVIRLEQGRGPHPSESVLSALTRALRLDDDERDHMFRLAGVAPPTPTRVSSVVSPRLQGLIDRLADLPVVVLDAKCDVIAWNEMATALLGDMSAWPPGQRNIVWQRFLGREGRVAMSDEERRQTEVQSVMSLREASARYPDDPGLGRLIAQLRVASPRFADLWDEGRSSQWRSQTKTIDHPELGRIVLDCDMLIAPDADQTVIVYSAEPGTPGAQALQLLGVIGSQKLSVRHE